MITGDTRVDGQGFRLSGNPLAYLFTLSRFDPMVLLALQLRRNTGEMLGDFRKHWALGFLGATTTSAAYAIVLWAMTKAPIEASAALSESSVVFEVLNGQLWFKESRLQVGQMAAASIDVGVLLIKS